MRGRLIFAAGMLIAGAASAAPLPLFAQRCAMCHQASGVGIPGQFPRLAGRTATLAQAPAGRRYLILVMLNGLVGPITVDKQPISGLMPSMAALPDADLAALLGHVTQLAPPIKGKKPAVFTAAEIAAVRKDGLIGPSGVAAARAKLPTDLLP